MQKMGFATLAALGAWLGVAAPAAAGDNTGDTLVRIQGTVLVPDSSAKIYSGGYKPTWDADVSTEVIPTLTITHFFTKNIAAELFCCFGKFNAEGKGQTPVHDLGDFWVFPPILTLQYHFDLVGGFKPYVGAGVQYIHFFDGGASDLSGAKIHLNDAWGFALQAGVDVELGKGWYLNADVKHVWLDTNADWHNGVTADVTVDPWIVSLGVGYRFNLSDLLGRRAEAAPLK